ncbi:MAG TPA: tetratricopeptide repeat protein [Rhizomicrobium sp.]|jgi:tetratricopeptide (TPR) repeat protein|nr:tetratricopeptide repeat protein [Rhizomicrobium sp.]
MNAHFADPYEQGLKLSGAGRHADAIGCFEQALVRKPDDTRALFALGNTARVLGLARPAEEFFRRVLALEPERVEALVNLANLLRTSGNFDAAEALLAPALTRNPDAAELWLTLGSVHRERGDGERAQTFYREALARRPDYSAALCNVADLLADAGEADEALALYDRAIKRDPHSAQARLNRAVLHLQRGNLKDGWRDYAARLKISGKAPVCDHALPRWDGGTLRGKRLLVTTEQGIGDQIMFASLFPELIARAKEEGGSVILECEPRLVSLFARSFPAATVKPSVMRTRGGITTAHYTWLKQAGGANLAIEMGSVPKFLRGDLARFPDPHAFLAPDAQETAVWREAFAAAGNGPHIGICWRSGKTGGARSLQYAPLAAWAEFLRGLTGTIVCVQYDATPDEIATLEAASGRRIVVPSGIDQKQELDRACGLFAALDAVVSAPTAVSWLASGAGVPVFKILYNNSWTAFGQSHEPLAPSCRCVMPQIAGDWRNAFAKAAGAL